MQTNRKLALAAIPLALAVTVGAVALGSRAGARTAEEEPANLPAVVYDEQNVTTDSVGKVTLRFDQGEHGESCLNGKAVFVNAVGARNLDDPGNAPVSFQAAHHQACDVVLVALNKLNAPIVEQEIRITYTASAATALGTGGGGTGVAGPPGPQGPAGPEGPAGPAGAAELTSPEVLAAVLGGLDPSVYESLTCGSFASQEAAQAAFDATGGNGTPGSSGPLEGLDVNNDGVACAQDEPPPAG